MKKIYYVDGEKERCVAEGLICGHCNEPLREPRTHNPCGTAFCSTCLAPETTCSQCQGTMASETSPYAHDSQQARCPQSVLSALPQNHRARYPRRSRSAVSDPLWPRLQD
jgi:hypothetical protein